MAGVEVRGMREFRRALRDADPEFPKELRRVHKKIADQAALRARGFAAGMGGVQAHAASTIKGRSTQAAARVSVSGVGNVAFWGAKKHTGWYAKRQYRDGPPQHPKWVGNSWEVAVAGQGPYAINNALAAYLPQLLDEYADMIDDLARSAFSGR